MLMPKVLMRTFPATPTAFRELSDYLLHEVVRCVRFESFDVDRVVFKQGEGHMCYI